MKKLALSTALVAVLFIGGCSSEEPKKEVAPKEEAKASTSYLGKITMTTPITDASANRKLTDEMTEKEFTRVMNSEEGKQAYAKLMDIFEKNISRIAKEGYYDMFIITYMNGRELGIESAFGALSRTEQHYVRNKIIYDLEMKGYTVKYNEYWDNPGALNISVSW